MRMSCLLVRLMMGSGVVAGWAMGEGEKGGLRGEGGVGVGGRGRVREGLGRLEGGGARYGGVVVGGSPGGEGSCRALLEPGVVVR